MAGPKDCAWCNRSLGSDYIAITKGRVPSGYELRFCSNRCYSEWCRAGMPNATCYKKGSCFITFAVCKSFNKPDDCAELTALRNFRDTFMMATTEMMDEVDEYYKIAPQICAEIEKSDDFGKRTYLTIWNKYLKSAVEAVNQNDNQKAYDIYKQMVMDLKREYLD